MKWVNYILQERGNIAVAVDHIMSMGMRETPVLVGTVGRKDTMREIKRIGV